MASQQDEDNMRLEWDVECYICEEIIPANTLPDSLQEDGYGFTWGSDGFFPDGASAMYCCNNCKSFWID